VTLSNEHTAAASEAYRHTADALAKGRDTEACVAACRAVVDIIEAEHDALRTGGAAIACAAGCAFCCHLRVGAYTHEAIALLDYLHTTPSRNEAAAVVERILENARRIDEMTVAEHYAARIPCAFLVDGRCAAYGVRPSACARYHSMSRARCERSFDNPRDMGTPRNSRPALRELQTFGAAVGDATEAALREARLSATTAELHQLLRAMIEEPSVVERWFAGEDIAATLTREP
jgi:Fe-S-cluster containining protein